MLTEKLGRNDLCPCGSKRTFQEMLLADRSVSTALYAIAMNGSNEQ
ncbi:MAG: SEC-C metal-binding domain-containing protein [Pseudomonadota bacterium]